MKKSLIVFTLLGGLVASTFVFAGNDSFGKRRKKCKSECCSKSDKKECMKDSTKAAACSKGSETKACCKKK